jgi:hypothetical protein
MPAYGLSENRLFKILSLADQILDGVAVADPRDVLGDNRTLIERRGHIVRGGTDNLDSSRISLVVRSPSRKGRQKAVVNVDNRDPGLREKSCAQHLHLPRQNDQIDLPALEDLQLCLLRLGLSIRFHLNVMKRQAHRLGKFAKIRMI